MASVHRLLAPAVQVREEESRTLLLMFLYSFLAMTADNILKPLAAGVFIAEFGAENLPFMILVAGHAAGSGFLENERHRDAPSRGDRPPVRA